MKRYSGLYIVLALFLVNSYSANVQFNKLPRSKIATILKWVPTTANICGGYFYEPPFFVNNQKPPPSQKTQVEVTAQQKAVYSVKGESTLEGDVVITQPGREFRADRVVFHRDPKSEKIISADLYGNVQLREYGKVLVGNHGYVNFKTEEVNIDNVLYRVATHSPTGNVNLWGRASKVVHDEPQQLTLKHATYSTCNPTCESWRIDSSTLNLNRKTGIGTLDNGVLFLKDVPVFYFPYLRFPIDKRRRTGFLYPFASYSSTNGFDITTPFYLNLAPNYDAFLIPRIFSKRGVLGQGKLRYLTNYSSGEFRVGYIQHDRLFGDFRDSAVQKYAGIPNLTTAVSNLRHSSTNRGAFSWQNQTQFTDNWSSNVDLNYVTDDYYLEDFGNLPGTINNNQLLNRADINYSSLHWNFLGRVQGFQTLHLVTDKTQAQDQYYRLPQLNLSADYPDQPYGLDYQWDSSFVNFGHEEEVPKVVTGQRINLMPSVGLPINGAAGFFNPQVDMEATFYALRNQPTQSPNGITRALPIIHVDSGLILERNFSLFNSDYLQTLEPRLFYLYVPYKNQNDIPVFDSDLPAFSYDNLFRVNRFSSIDRVGDANQVAMALTSRVLDAATGLQRLKLGIGEIFAFQKHRITLPGTETQDPLLTSQFSPLAGIVSYNILRDLALTGGMAWNFEKGEAESGSATLQYNPAVNTVFNIGYSYEKAIPNVSLFTTSLAWPLTRHWHVVADWNYDLTARNLYTSLYGLEYDSCCWALRAVVSRVLTGYDESEHKNIFDQRYYIQIMLKGLGSVGTKGGSSLLTGNISGFQDNFATGIL